jgi:hypothetical protein
MFRKFITVLTVINSDIYLKVMRFCLFDAFLMWVRSSTENGTTRIDGG